MVERPSDAGILWGGPLEQTYKLLQLHFHWGTKDSQGSEHTFNEKRFPMEMHLVHKASTVESVESALQTFDGLAVAAFLFEVSH